MSRGRAAGSYNRGVAEGAIKRRLRSARSTVGRAARGVLRLPRATAGAARGFWSDLSVITRRRLVAALAVFAVLVAFVTLAVPNLPCQFPGGDSCPPPDDALELVPADALAYVHANLDPDEEQYVAATEIADLVPNLSSQLGGRAVAELPGADAIAPEFERDVRPWFGGEAAVVVVGGVADAPEQIVLLEVADADGASDFATELAGATDETEEYRGTQLGGDGVGLATARLEDFLAIGRSDGIRALIDVATGAEGVTSLADDPAADELRDELPDHTLIDAYLSQEGVSELVGDSRGIESSLAPFMAPGTSTGAVASVSAADGALELSVRSALDTAAAEAEPPFFAAFPPFEPKIPARLAADALGYLGFGDPATTVQALLGQAAAQAPAIVSGFEDLARDLREQGGVDLEGDLLAGLGSEAAFAVEPRSGDFDLPYLEFVADGVDEDEARRALAALQGPLADAVDPGSGLQAPVFDEDEIEGVDVRTLRLSPAVELAFAVFDGLAVVATDPQGIERLAGTEGGLDESALFARATDEFPDEVSMQGFFDLGQLVSTGENLGLAEDPVYAAFAGEFRRLDAFAFAVSEDESLLISDAKLVFDE